MGEPTRRAFWVSGRLHSWEKLVESSIPPIGSITFVDIPAPLGFLQVYEREADAVEAAGGVEVFMIMVQMAGT